jgi:multiple sugar transport system permease protein
VSWTSYFAGYGALIVVVNVDPHGVHRGWIDLDLAALGLDEGDEYQVHDVLSEARYVGLQNYRHVAADDVFYLSLGNTAFMVIRLPLIMLIGLLIAMMLNRSIRGIGAYRTAFVLPSIVPIVAAVLLWSLLLNPAFGAVNQVLSWIFSTAPAHWIEAIITRLIGGKFEFALPGWYTDVHWSKPSLILMSLWGAGGGMIIWLAGLQSIPRQLYEAAEIDGASALRRFRHITLPMLSPYILFNAIVGLIATMQIFTEAYIMISGGPADSTLFYAYYLFRNAFQYFRMGYASALAWILFLIVLALTLIQLWACRKWVHYERT